MVVLSRSLAFSLALARSLPPSLPLSLTSRFLSLSMKEAESLYYRSLSLAAGPAPAGAGRDDSKSYRVFLGRTH